MLFEFQMNLGKNSNMSFSKAGTGPAGKLGNNYFPTADTKIDLASLPHPNAL